MNAEYAGRDKPPERLFLVALGLPHREPQSKRGRTIREFLAGASDGETKLMAAIWHVYDADYPYAQVLPMGFARNIVEGRSRWPDSPVLNAWKHHKELCHVYGSGAEPPWWSPRKPRLSQFKVAPSQLRFSRSRR